MTTKSQQIAADVATLLRARNPLLWVVTREEAGVERYLVEAASAAGYLPRFWDCAQGASDISGKPLRDIGSADIGAMLADITSRAQRSERDDGTSHCVLALVLTAERGVESMTMFRLLVTRDITESITVQIAATDADDAARKVADMLPDCGAIEAIAIPGSNWEVDGDSRQSGDVYITGDPWDDFPRGNLA